jgi:hypothetical protein
MSSPLSDCRKYRKVVSGISGSPTDRRSPERKRRSRGLRRLSDHGVLGVKDAEGLALAAAQEVDTGESRVRLEVAGRGQQPERLLLGIGGLDDVR